MADSKRARSWKRRTLPRIDLTNAEPVLYSTLGLRPFETSGLLASPSPVVEIALREELSVRDTRWSEAVAVSSLAFVERIKGELGFKAHRQVIFRFER